MNKKPAIIIDLDGTLSNASHRLYLLEETPKNWEKFFAEAKKDKVNQWCADIIYFFNQADYEILIVTGRGTEERLNTTKWLVEHGITYDRLFMRLEKDKRPDTVVKAELYKEFIAPKYNVVFAVDDRASVIRMWRELGVTALQCDDWEDRAGKNVHKEIASYYQKKDNR